jgi:hypothetical protein
VFHVDNARLKSETKMVDSWVRMGFGVKIAIWLIGVENRSNPKESLWLCFFIRKSLQYPIGIAEKSTKYPNSLNA